MPQRFSAVRRGQRRDMILDAALAEFARWGYDGASTNRIAATARVAKGLLFRHFGSKDALFAAALERACGRVFALDGPPLPADPFLRLEEFVARRVQRLAAHSLEARFVARFRGGLHSVLSAPARRIEGAYAPLRRAFQEGADGSAFRRGTDPLAAVELLALVAEGFEGQVLDSLAAAGEDPPGGAAAVLDPLIVRQRARGMTDLLRSGIYRPGARLEGPTVPVNPAGFLAVTERLAPVGRSADERRERILRAAQVLFAERGYEGAPVEAIAAAAGVAKGLVFHHFGSKAELYRAAVADAAARISGLFFARESGPGTDLFRRLMDWTRRKLEIFQGEPVLYGLVLSAFADPPAPVREAVRQYVSEGLERGWEIVLEGVDMSPFRAGVEPALAVELVMLVVNTLTRRLMVRLGNHPRRGLDLLPELADQAETYLVLLRDGVGAGDDVPRGV